jgi:hypothetical protein
MSSPVVKVQTSAADVLDAAIQLLWKRLESEEYGHAKAAVALDIEALEGLRTKVRQI